MADKEIINETEMDDEEVVVVMMDDDGNEHYFIEEMLIPVGDETYALLVPDTYDGEEAEDEDEDSAFFAKVVTGEDGEDEYIEPTDEEFDKVNAIYEEMMKEEEAE